MPNKQTRKEQIAHSSIENDIFVGAECLSDQMLGEINQLLSIWGMTALQYNALRVLYVQDDQDRGIPSGEIGRHLYTRVPDVTRLLDRLADKGWLSRERDPDNRRVVRARLSEIGVELVESAFSSLKELQAKQLSHMDHKDKKELKRLLKLALEESSI